MLLRSYQKLICKFAIFLVMFASLAPGVSYALAAKQSNGSFLQEICSSDGTKKIVIQTITTQGQQIATVLDTTKPQHDNANIGHHLEHCPFCGNAMAHSMAAPPSPAWVLLLAAQSKVVFYHDAVLPQPAYLQTAQASRAPPFTLI